jgi:hypothetical protein
MIRFAYFGTFLVALVGPAWARAPVESGAAARRKGLVSAMVGSKVCPSAMSAPPRPDHLPPAAHITGGVGNP